MNHFNRLNPAELERLAILGEELGEVQQIIGKILRHGYESCDPTEVLTEAHPNSTINRWLLEKELGHVLWIMRMMCAAHDINGDRIESGAKEKSERPQNYLHHQPIKIKYEDECLCGGVGCNSCEPQGRG